MLSPAGAGTPKTSVLGDFLATIWGPEESLDEMLKQSQRPSKEKIHNRRRISQRKHDYVA